MVLWLHGTLAPWAFDPIGICLRGTLIPCGFGTMGPQSHGRLATWEIGHFWPLLVPVNPILPLFENNMPQLKMRN